MKSLRKLAISVAVVFISSAEAQEKVTALGVSLGMQEAKAFAELSKLETRGFRVIPNANSDCAIAMLIKKEHESELGTILTKLENEYSLIPQLVQGGIQNPTIEQMMFSIFASVELSEEFARIASFPVLTIFVNKDSQQVTQLLMNPTATVLAYNSGGMTAQEISQGILEKYKTPEFKKGGKLADFYYKTKTEKGEMIFVFSDKTVKFSDASKAKF